MNAFPDHGMRFGRTIQGYYITIDDINSCYTKIGISSSEQLLETLRQTTDTDIIKVIINTLFKKYSTHISKVADVKADVTDRIKMIIYGS